MIREAITALLDRIRRTYDDAMTEWPHRPLVLMATLTGIVMTGIFAVQAHAGERTALAAIGVGLATIGLGFLWWTITPPYDDTW